MPGFHAIRAAEGLALSVILLGCTLTNSTVGGPDVWNRVYIHDMHHSNDDGGIDAIDPHTIPLNQPKKKSEN